MTRPASNRCWWSVPFALLGVLTLSAQDVEVPVGEDSPDELSLDEISQQLENPLSKLWSLNSSAHILLEAPN